MADSRFETIMNLPDISFIDNMTLEDTQNKAIELYTGYLAELEGETPVISRADPYRLILLACAQMIHQGYERIDFAGKMNFIKYVFGDYLDNYSAGKKVLRKDSKPATAKVKFSLAAARDAVTPIPTGTRVTSDMVNYFATTEYAEIPAGETEITLTLTCEDEGVEGNGILAGEMTTLVDSVPYIASVTNVMASTGGEDVEDDDHLKVRTFLAPSAYSVTGTEDAYEYWVLDASSNIGDVKVKGTEDAEVDIRFVMADGSIPDEATIDLVRENVTRRDVKTLTDHINVGVPSTVDFGISATYYISRSDSSSAGTISSAALEAASEYAKWQQQKIGRDINPDEFTARLKAAGVKRVVITAPVYAAVDDDRVAKLAGGINLTYGGLEND